MYRARRYVCMWKCLCVAQWLLFYSVTCVLSFSYSLQNSHLVSIKIRFSFAFFSVAVFFALFFFSLVYYIFLAVHLFILLLPFFFYDLYLYTLHIQDTFLFYLYLHRFRMKTLALFINKSLMLSLTHSLTLYIDMCVSVRTRESV